MSRVPQIAIGLYGIGVPLFYAGLLRSARHAIQGEGETRLSRALTFLHSAFNYRVLWWPLVEASRILLLIGFLALVEPGSLVQIFCAITAAIGYNVLHLWFAPYKDASNNFLASNGGMGRTPDYVVARVVVGLTSGKVEERSRL